MWGNTNTGSMTSTSFTASFNTSGGEISHDPENGVYLSNRLRPLYKKISMDKERLVCTMMSSFLVNVSLAWYLLLLNFDLKDELADDLSPSTVTGSYVRGK